MMKTVLSFTACFSILAMPISADESTPDMNQAGSQNGISEEGLLYYNSDEHQEALKEKISKVSIKSPRAATKLLSTPQYTQEKSFYCGPASAQIIIQYLTGTKYSQDYLAGQMGTVDPKGTYIDALAPQLVRFTGLNYEVTNNYQYYFYNNMVQDINAGDPIVYDVDPYYFGVGYGHMGHFVVGNGYGTESMCYYWDVNGNMADEWHISASEMSQALNANGGYYVW